MTLWTGEQLVARQLPAHRATQTFMPQVGIEPTIGVFERAKKIHSSESPATVIDLSIPAQDKLPYSEQERVELY
jgi:hypothetical protein